MDNSITVYAQRQGEATVFTIRHPAGAIPDEQSAERLLKLCVKLFRRCVVRNDQLNIAHALRQVGGRFFFYFYIHRYAAKDVIGGDVEEVGDFAKCAKVRFSLIALPASIYTAYDVQFCSHFFLG